jgi:hypothetical protein
MYDKCQKVYACKVKVKEQLQATRGIVEKANSVVQMLKSYRDSLCVVLSQQYLQPQNYNCIICAYGTELASHSTIDY